MTTTSPRDGFPGRAASNARRAASDRRVVVALHGILVPGDRVSWPEEFARWAAGHLPGWQVVTQNYWRWPTPRWAWVQNIFRARKLAALLEPQLAAGARLYFVGHSNGAAIALRTARLLTQAGWHIDGLLLVAAAVPEDVDESGIRHMLRHGRLGRAEAWCSQNDGVVRGFGPRWMQALWRRLMWPWGQLGCKGFEERGRRADGVRLRTRWFSGTGHTDYFRRSQQSRVFPMVYEFLTRGSADSGRATPAGHDPAARDVITRNTTDRARLRAEMAATANRQLPTTNP